VLDVLPDTLPLAASERSGNASSQAGVSPKNRAWNFFALPPESRPAHKVQVAETASGCTGCSYEIVSGRTLWKVYGPDLNGRFGGLQGTGGLEAVILDAEGTTTGVINDQFGNGVATVTGTGSGASVTWNTTRVGAYGPLPGITPQTLGDVTQLAATTAWRSRRIDPTGFYWLGARYYEPTSGRFLSADPAGHAASPSLYDYAGGDPVNGIDPDGRLQTKMAQFANDPFGNAGLLNDIYADVKAINDFNDGAGTVRTGENELSYNRDPRIPDKGALVMSDVNISSRDDVNRVQQDITEGIQFLRDASPTFAKAWDARMNQYGYGVVMNPLSGQSGGTNDGSNMVFGIATVSLESGVLSYPAYTIAHELGHWNQILDRNNAAWNVNPQVGTPEAAIAPSTAEWYAYHFAEQVSREIKANTGVEIGTQPKYWGHAGPSAAQPNGYIGILPPHKK
jgi:RHS repeat-associated protein